MERADAVQKSARPPKKPAGEHALRVLKNGAAEKNILFCGRVGCTRNIGPTRQVGSRTGEWPALPFMDFVRLWAGCALL